MNSEAYGPLLVLIGGCHASGKLTAATLVEEELLARFPRLHIVKIDMRAYFTSASDNRQTPQQFDFKSMALDVETKYADADVMILFGLYALYDVKIRKLATLSVFIDCDADVRLGRWIKRDVLGLPKEEQKAMLETVMDHYLNFAREEMKQYIGPTKEYADVILPRGADSTGVVIIVDGLQPLLDARHGQSLLDSSKALSSASLVDDRSLSAASGARLLPQVSTPSVLSLSQDNFTNQNKRFYDIN